MIHSELDSRRSTRFRAHFRAHPRVVFAVLTASTLAVTGVAAPLLPATSAQAAPSACTADAGYTQCVALDYSGSGQVFTLPNNAKASAVLVKMWGAGGGGVGFSIIDGGSGGYSSGTLDLTANRAMTVVVGGGGQPGCGAPSEDTGSSVATYGGGGPSAGLPPAVSDPNNWYCGASGGGRSAVRVGAGIPTSSASSEVLTAGGGGGASNGTSGVAKLGGPGGGLVGGDGSCSVGSTCPGSTGFGGTQVAGGAPGQMGSLSDINSPVYFNDPANGGHGYIAATAGSQFQGGMSGSGFDSLAYESGGGGGGGYFGGGGGGLNTSPNDAPGGGGSGHVDPMVGGGSTTASASYFPNGMNESQYVSGVGVGGGTHTSVMPGGNGLVIVQYNLAAVPGPPVAVTVEPGSNEATVSFLPPLDDGGSPITHYTVTATNVSNPNAPPVTVSAGNGPITITGLNNGDLYEFTVTASNAAGEGPAAAAVLARLAGGAAPGDAGVAQLAVTGVLADASLSLALALLLGGAIMILVASSRRKTMRNEQQPSN